MRLTVRKDIVVLLGALAVAACSTPAEVPAPGDHAAAPAHVVPAARGRARAPEADPRVSKAVALLARGARPPQIDETRARRGQVDAAGDVHVVLDSFRKGRRVLGAELVRHVLADGTVLGQDGDDELGAVTFDDTPPAVDEAHAVMAARESMKPLGARVDATYPELVYERQGAAYRLAYRVDLVMNIHDTGELEWRVWIDPNDATVVRRLNVTRHTVGVGRSLFYGSVPVQTFYYAAGPDRDVANSGFTLEDWLRPAGGEFIKTSSYLDEHAEPAPLPVGFFAAVDDFGNYGDLSAWTMKDPLEGPLSTTGQTAGVDAHHSSGWAWDLYVDVFHREGPFGDGAGFWNVVNYPGGTSFNTRTRTMLVGMKFEGKGCTAQSDLTIVGHEIAHAFFTTHIADSTYTGETGGLDEANSDIIGKLTEMYGKTGMASNFRTGVLPRSWADWNILMCGRTYRSMYHPSVDTRSYDAWSPNIESLHVDAHYASGPINRMFYFLSTGVADQQHGILSGGESSSYLPRGMLGLGIPDAADVYYRALVNHLRPNDPKFVDLRRAMEEAAGRNTTTKKAVQDAFAAINVGPPADRTGPTISAVTTKSAPGATVGATVSDPSGVKNVSYSVGTRNWGGASSAPWSITVPADVTTGTYSFEVCALDMLDNRTCTLGNIQIDGNSPNISLFEVTNPFVAANKTVHLTAYDGSGINFASIQFGGTLLYAKDYIAVPWGQDLTTIDLSPTLVLPANLADGTYTLEARVSDAFNLPRTKAATFLWDKTPPDACRFADVRPAYLPDDTTNALVSDATSGVASVQFFFDGLPAGTYSALNAPPKTLSTVGMVWSNKSPGQHTVSVTCTDRFGLASTQSMPIRVGPRPLALIGGLGQAATPTRSFTYHVRVTASDGLGYVGSGVQCMQSGYHSVTTALVGTPTVFEKTFTVTNLILGETCDANITAEDRFGLRAYPASVHFIVKDPPPPTNACNAVVHSGANMPASYTIDIGAKTGSFDFMRNTYNIADYMALSCADGGTVNGYASYSPGACESTQDWITTTLPFNCNSTRMKVSVTPNCDVPGDTRWDLSLGCAY